MPSKVTTGAEQVHKAFSGTSGRMFSDNLRPLHNQANTGARPLLDDASWAHGEDPTVYVHTGEENWVQIGDAAARLIASVIKAQEVKK